jgi:hypothetical protein
MSTTAITADLNMSRSCLDIKTARQQQHGLSPPKSHPGLVMRHLGGI